MGAVWDASSLDTFAYTYLRFRQEFEQDMCNGIEEVHPV